MAVYTEVTDEEAAGFVDRYDLGALLSLKGIAEGVENSNFLIVTGRGPFILTLYEKRVSETDLPFFIAVMRHLAERGIACPQPVAARDGTRLGRLAGRPAAIVSFLEGMWPRRITAEHCQQLGAGLAAMHRAGADFAQRRTNDLSLDGWQRLAALTAARAHEVQPGLTEALADELDHLAAHWPGDLPTGLVHADLFPDNVFFRGGRLSGFIDFYFSCTDFLAYDLAVCLNAWCFEPDGQFNVTKARGLLRRYRQGRDMTPAELHALPLLARGAAIRFLLTRLYDWLHQPPGAFVRPKDPLEYWAKLRFHQQVTGIGAYGLDP